MKKKFSEIFKSIPEDQKKVFLEMLKKALLSKYGNIGD